VEQLLADTECLAVNLHQSLAPLSGWDVPVWPAAGSDVGATPTDDHSREYPIDDLKDGTQVVCLDPITNQTLRMKGIFSGPLAGYVPSVTIADGDQTWSLTELTDGLADERVKASDLATDVRDALTTYAQGSPLALAAIDPLSLVHGVDDRGDSGVQLPPLVRSEIQAWDVDILSATGAFGRADERGAPTDSSGHGDGRGGVIVHGRIQHTATLDLAGMRALEEASSGLGTYVHGLALGGLWRGACDYDLRPGCRLVPNGPASIEAVYRNGRRTSASLSGAEVGKALLSASAGARQLELPIGEQRRGTLVRTDSV
jgi:CRISPR-associated protein Csb1